MFWQGVCVPFVRYKWAEYRMRNETDQAKVDAVFNPLHDKYAPKIEALTLKLRGFYLKNAQICSTLDYFVPKQYLEFCKRMQSEVPTSLEPGQARRVVAEALRDHGYAFDDVFASFEDEPVGSASIGQTHRAVRRDGRVVAIKVMAPGIEEKFRSDIRTILRFCQVAMPHHVATMREIEKQFVTEFDYLGEAGNLQRVRANVMPIFGDKVVIPAPHLELCSKHVLVMDFLDGPSLVKGIRQSYAEFAASRGTTLEALEAEQKREIERPDYQFRDTAEEARRVRRLRYVMRAGDALSNSWRVAYNYSLGWALGRPVDYVHTKPLINLGEVLQLLADVHGHEIIIDGCFNADPHPGNVLLLKDGRLGLIDYGQTAYLKPKERLAYARLIIALANDDEIEVVRVAREFGGKTRYGKPDIAYKLMCFWNDRTTDDVTGGRNIQQFMDWAEAEDPVVAASEAIVMPARVSIMLRGLGNAFGLRLRMSKWWEPLARQALSDAGVDYRPRKTRAIDFVD